MLAGIAATSSGFAMTHRRCTSPYSSRSSVAGAELDSASARIACDAMLRVRVQHEKLSGVRTRMAKPFQAIRFRAGKSFARAKKQYPWIVLELSGADKAAAVRRSSVRDGVSCV